MGVATHGFGVMLTNSADKSYEEALEKAAEHLHHAEIANDDFNATLSQARVEALNWAYDFDKNTLHAKKRELYE